MDEKLIAEEKEYLKETMAILREKLGQAEAARADAEAELLAKRRDIWDKLMEMDEGERGIELEEAKLLDNHYVELYKKLSRLEDLLYSPYFGKIELGLDSGRENVYIGLSQLDDRDGSARVVDWRAPVSDVYYNCDIGPASYVAPAGEVKGELYNKYQFKITKGELRYVVDVSTTILDEVLLAELGKNASPMMRNIAATIQREQNRIIRHSHGDNILVCGVAGSGKTSIALHRIAYILYHCREAIRANNVLIITPNKAFTKYIGNVLPELGEEMAAQMSIEDIASIELADYSVQSRVEYLESVYAATPTEAAIASMRYKASMQFVQDVEAFARRVDMVCFRPRDFVVGVTYSCPKSTFETLYYKRFANSPSVVRMRKIVDYVLRDMAANYHSRLSDSLQQRVREMIMSMYHRYDMPSLYRLMLRELHEKTGAPVLVPEKGAVIPYEDVYGMIYLKYFVEGAKLKGDKIKHLVIDEMQDYTPVQYAYFNRIYTCSKTVLGDVCQMADPFMNIGDEATARAMLGGEKCVTYNIHTSYRSSYEIATYANRFTPNEISPVDRHGDEPVVLSVTEEDRVKEILRQIRVAIDEKGYTSVAIIARSAEEARRLYQALRPAGVQLLLSADAPYIGGVVVATAFSVKGFEFDQVIVADASEAKYGNPWDDRLLYISVTRALHRLVMLYTGTPSRYLGVK